VHLFGGNGGTPFQALGESNGKWHDLEVVVTPKYIVAKWNGEPLFLDAVSTRASLSAAFRDHPPPAVGGFGTKSLAGLWRRGAMGLYVWRGSASFRSITVTPLSIPPQP
jgi:hypothetical protein